MLYDLNGNRIGKSGERTGADGRKQALNTAYSYDLMNRLTLENRIDGGEKYAYDKNGNLITKESYHHSAKTGTVVDGEETYCYNEHNQLTKKYSLSAATSYTYDRNGSLVLEKEGERTTSYRYDLLNRQTYVKMPDGREQENLYDGEGLRAGIKESGRAAMAGFSLHIKKRYI